MLFRCLLWDQGGLASICRIVVSGISAGLSQKRSEYSAIHRKLTRSSRDLYPSCAVRFTSSVVILKESKGSITPIQLFPEAMLVKSLFVYTLTLAVGLGAVTHAKTQLIEQSIQERTENLLSAHHKNGD